MVVNRRKKCTKYRAHTTHGGGHRKKRRGAGSRGGRGMAGSGKRASHKVAGGVRFSPRKGFLPRRGKTPVSAVNVGYFTDSRVEKLLAAGKASKKGDVVTLNLADLGFLKLLGTGSTSIKLKITARYYSARAQEKIEAAGGEIVSQESAEKAQAETQAKAAPQEGEAASA